MVVGHTNADYSWKEGAGQDMRGKLRKHPADHSQALTKRDRRPTSSKADYC